MIKYFAVENFKSIKNEAILEFDQHLGKDYPYPSSSIIGVAGANASGKTCILQALTFVLWFMQHSFLRLKEDEKIPYSPFVNNESKPTKFCLIFVQKQLIDQEEKWVDYEYSLTLLKNSVRQETVNYYPYGRKRMAYTRSIENIKLGNTIRNLSKEILENMRDNASIISFASQFSTQTVAQNMQNYALNSNLSNQSTNEYVFSVDIMQSLAKNIESKDKATLLLKIADIGIINFSLINIPNSRDDNLPEKHSPEKLSEKILEGLGITKLRQALQENEVLKFLNSLNSPAPSFPKIAPIIKFQHKIDDTVVNFTPNLESAGTLQFLTLLDKVLTSLKQGGVLIIDEIELKLHQNLIAYLIGLFQNREENPHDAQLIFSFHNTSLMEILEPHQLYFTEKNDQGQTEIFSAVDFTDIKDLYKRNLEELYRFGRFGAKPRGI